VSSAENKKVEMDQEEEVETPDDDHTETVVVNVDAEPDDAGDTIVVVPPTDDTESSPVDGVVVATALDHEGRLAALEAENAELRERLAHTEVTADYAEVIAESALEEAYAAEEETEEEIEDLAEATDETIDEVVDEVNDGKDGDDEEIIPDDEITPVSARVHPLFRSFSDWKSGR
jgi:hypothetical protein